MNPKNQKLPTLAVALTEAFRNEEKITSQVAKGALEELHTARSHVTNARKDLQALLGADIDLSLLDNLEETCRRVTQRLTKLHDNSAKRAGTASARADAAKAKLAKLHAMIAKLEAEVAGQ